VSRGRRRAHRALHLHQRRAVRIGDARVRRCTHARRGARPRVRRQRCGARRNVPEIREA
jgi:hypothetical protein